LEDLTTLLCEGHNSQFSSVQFSQFSFLASSPVGLVGLGGLGGLDWRTGRTVQAPTGGQGGLRSVDVAKPRPPMNLGHLFRGRIHLLYFRSFIFFRIYYIYYIFSEHVCTLCTAWYRYSCPLRSIYYLLYFLEFFRIYYIYHIFRCSVHLWAPKVRLRYPPHI